jgi:hypothetical protein
LKKRNKKLLFLARRCRVTLVGPMASETDKSFLVLFFKKELLPWRLPLPAGERGATWPKRINLG